MSPPSCLGEEADKHPRCNDDHPIYDMVYVAVAERRGAVLVTADEGLRRRLSTLAWVIGPDPITA
jgi:predicted nucleic acid-binding protein